MRRLLLVNGSIQSGPSRKDKESSFSPSSFFPPDGSRNPQYGDTSIHRLLKAIFNILDDFNVYFPASTGGASCSHHRSSIQIADHGRQRMEIHYFTGCIHVQTREHRGSTSEGSYTLQQSQRGTSRRVRAISQVWWSCPLGNL